MIKENFFILFALLIVKSIGVFGQKTYVLISEDSLNPIPFAHIHFFNNDSIIGGTHSDIKGVFSVNDKSVLKIEVHHLSYKVSSFLLSEINSVDILFLEVSTVVLDEISILSKRRKENFIGIKPSVFPTNYFNFTCRRKEALILLQCNESENQIIRSFVFYPKVLNSKVEIRLRVVMYLNESGLPGMERLVEQEMLLSKNNKGKTIIDLDEPLLFPREGIFVGIEILNCYQSSTGKIFDNNIENGDVLSLKSRMENDSMWGGAFVLRFYKSQGYSDQFGRFTHYPLIVPSFGVKVINEFSRP